MKDRLSMNQLILLQLSILPTILGCIDSYAKLENEILSNGDNLHSLIRAFYPSNQQSGLFVEVKYYLNYTDGIEHTIPVHPVLLTNNTDIYEASYIFYWGSSSVFLFGNPNFLEGVTFRFLTFPRLVADIVIKPFCDSLDESQILRVLDDITIWLKSYAVQRSRSLDTRFQGYSQYVKNGQAIVISLPDIFFYLFIMVGAMVLFELLGQVLASVLLWSYHDTLCDNLNNDNFRGQLQVNSIFWSIVICSFIGEIILVGLGLHFYSIIFQTSGFQKILFTVSFIVLVGFLLYDVTIALFFSIMKKKVKLPEFLSISKEGNRCHEYFTHTMQFLAIFSFMLSALLLPIFIFGLILGLLVNPLRIFSMVVVTMILVIVFIRYLSYIFEQCTTSKRSKRCVIFTARLFILFMLCLFIVMVSFTYLSVILFTGPDKTRVLNQLAEFFPALLLTLILWIVKKQYEKFRDKTSANTTDLNLP